MRSTFTGLTTMVRGIYANQLSLDTTGHNIVNAGTDGYSRQSANLAATRGQLQGSLYGDVMVGTGVDAMSVQRARDIYADIQFRNETPTQNYYETLSKTFDKLEVLFDDSHNDGMQDAISKFYTSWVDLSANASNTANRVAVIDQGKILSDTIQTKAENLQEQIRENYEDIRIKVTDVNELMEAIVATNKEITAAEATGSNANDLRDQRDLLTDQLAGYINISVTEDSVGAYQIVSGGITLINGVERLHLAMAQGVSSSVYGADYGVSDYQIMIKESRIVYQPQNGTLKAQFDAIDECKKYIDELANMSNFLLTTFNEQHKQGYDLNGSHKTDANGNVVPDTINFYGVTGETYTFGYDPEKDINYMDVTTAAGATERLTGIRIINCLETNAKFEETGGSNYIAATTSTNADGSQNMEWSDRTGDGTNAVYMSELFNIHTNTIIETGRANAAIMKLYTLKDADGNEVLDSDGNPTYINAAGNLGLNGYYQACMTQLGVDSRSNDTKIGEQDAIMTQIQNWRDSTSGVDWNEELTNMIRFQKGYSSCARCLTAMDEMLDRLVNNTGVVGR